ncbi:hypothetical protein HDU96_000301 [Phlyctochytrium bullatum]|nr:hypothetical protein HDU96_000301 [Phlyctochytrium bullatum]
MHSPTTFALLFVLASPLLFMPGADAQSRAVIQPESMREWLTKYATTAYSDSFTPRPMTFGTVGRLLESQWAKISMATNGTLFVASDDVYQAAGATTGGYSFIRNTVIDYTFRNSKPGDPDAGLYHFDYFVDNDFNISFIWDDYAPGRPLESGQVWGRDRRIYIHNANEVSPNSCSVQNAVFCRDGLIQVTSCVLNQSPRFSTAVENVKRLLAVNNNYGEWVKIVEKAGWLDMYNNLPFNKYTVFAATDDAVLASTALRNASTAELQRIIAYNTVLNAYPSDDHPAEADTALVGQKRTIGPDTAAGAADIVFYGGIIRGVMQVALPRSADASSAQITGLPLPSSGTGPSSATVSASAGVTGVPGTSAGGAVATGGASATTTSTRSGAGRDGGAGVSGSWVFGTTLAVIVALLGALVA